MRQVPEAKDHNVRGSTHLPTYLPTSVQEVVDDTIVLSSSPYCLTNMDGSPDFNNDGTVLGGTKGTGITDTPKGETTSPNPPSSLSMARDTPVLRQVSNISLPKTKSGILGTSSNLMNSIVGAGIIGIPYAIRQAGFIVGLLLLLLVAYLTDKSLRVIIELASFHPKLKDLGVLTYEDLMTIPFGRAGNYFVLVNMFILAYGAMVAYLLIIKDTVPVVLRLEVPENQDTNTDGDFWEREFVMLITSLVIVVPLSMMRDMASLAFTSLLSVTADVVLVGFVIAFSPVKSSVSDAGGFGQILADNWINSKLFIGLGVLSTAMACQHSAFIVSGSLENKTAARWAAVTFRSITTSVVLCILLGVAGYLGFLDETRGDILNNFDADSVPANAGRGLLAVTMFFTYPMECFVARHVLVKLLYNGDMDAETVGPDGQVVPEHKWLFGLLGRRERLTLVIYIATLIPALFLNDLGPVLSLTGSLGASCVAYMGPGLVYFGINGDAFLAYTRELLAPHGSSTSTDPQGEIELPVVGDPTATMEQATGNDHASTSRTGKPWWWWVYGFPLWTAIASRGARGTKEFLAALELETGEPLRGPSEDSDEVIGAHKSDYYMSMFFVAFGLVAAVVGVASNIYVQVNNVFFTPT